MEPNVWSVCICLALVINCSTALVVGRNNRNTKECNLPQEIVDDIAGYAETADRILNHYIDGPFKGQTWKRLSDFIDLFGNRLTGSKVLEDSIDYILAASEGHGLDNVDGEELEVPLWVRGEESATLLKPREKNLPMLGLGTSVGTPEDGLTANVIVVKSYEDLKSLADEDVEGKIVVYDQDFVSYSDTVQYRRNGAAEAARKGAVACLVKSITPFSIASPHTGSQYYAEDVPRIPTAAITMEDADFLWREQERGSEIVIHIKMFPMEDTVISRNIVVELEGSSMQDKVVVVSGHVDSWDVGVGAMDDAGGSFISWLAPIVLKDLGLRPKRTLRAVLFTAEEQGIIGANEYAERHKDENDNLNFVMESDAGTFAPLGLVYSGSKEGECMIREVLKLFTSINATQLELGSPGPDIDVWASQGIPGGGLLNANDRYFWFHHTEGDSMNVLDADVMDRNGGFWAAVSYIIADMKYDIPRD